MLKDKLYNLFAQTTVEHGDQIFRFDNKKGFLTIENKNDLADIKIGTYEVNITAENSFEISVRIDDETRLTIPIGVTFNNSPVVFLDSF